MKILLVNKFLYPRGGAETYLLKIGNELKKRGHEVEYFGMYDERNIVGNSAKQYTANMDFHTSKIKKIVYPFKIIYSFEAKRKIKKVIEIFKPDIIHLNNINFQLTPSIIDIANKMKIPVIQTVHDYQMICPNHLLYNGSICENCIKSSKWNCSKNKCIHNSRIKSVIGSIEGILYTKIKKTYRKISKFICPSQFLENKLLEASNIYIYKTVTIHNFIELSNIQNDYEKKDYVLFFGRLSEEKGLRVFIETCKELPNIKFKIAGMGPLENICKNTSSNIEFLGFKTGKELKKLISEAVFSVYPSIWYENCPLSILESQSLGTPVITANYGGMKELVENKETGILVDHINKDSLKQKISELYKNKDLLKQMQINCINKRNKMISLKEYCDKIIKIYEEIVHEV